MFKNRRKDERDTPRSLNRGETERGSARGSAGEGVGQISRGCRGIQLSFVLPAIFCHPFALLFSAVETAPQSILVETLYRATSLRKEKERGDEREEEAGRRGRGIGGGRKGGGRNSPAGPGRARGEEERAE